MQESINNFEELGVFSSVAFDDVMLDFNDVQLCFIQISLESCLIGQIVVCIH